MWERVPFGLCFACPLVAHSYSGLGVCVWQSPCPTCIQHVGKCLTFEIIKLVGGSGLSILRCGKLFDLLKSQGGKVPKLKGKLDAGQTPPPKKKDKLLTPYDVLYVVRVESFLCDSHCAKSVLQAVS